MTIDFFLFLSIIEKIAFIFFLLTFDFFLK